MLKIEGELCALGDVLDDMPGFQLLLADGRIITVVGLTRDETRALVPALMRDMVLTVTPGVQPTEGGK